MRKHQTLMLVGLLGLFMTAASACRDGTPTTHSETTASPNGTAGATGSVTAVGGTNSVGTVGAVEPTSNGSTTGSAAVAETIVPLGEDVDQNDVATDPARSAETESVIVEMRRIRRKKKAKPAAMGRGGSPAGRRAKAPDGQIGLFAIEGGEPAPVAKMNRSAGSMEPPKRSVAVIDDAEAADNMDRMSDKVPDDVKEKAGRSLSIVNSALSKSLDRKGFNDKNFQQKSSVQQMMNQMKAFGGGDERFEALRKQAAEAQAQRRAEREGLDPDFEFEGFENRTVSTERIIAKPMIETATEPMSTFAVDVDTGAYTLARARLREGYLPKPDQIRAEEFLNYFHYDYPSPKEGAFAVALEASADPFDSSRHLLRVGVQGREVSDDERPPAHLTFLVDVSGSMFGPDKLGLAREALELVTRNLRPDDTVAIVTYARGAKVQMWPAGANESDIVLANIAAIEPGGSSALDEGLRLAYRVASTHYDAADINRVVVMSDGRANTGETRPQKVLQTVRAGVEDGVMLSTIGFGAKSFNDKMMEQLADRGDGNYFFVDSYLEAQRVFGDRLCGTINTIAKDVKIQVEFDPNSVVKHRLVGYENRKLKTKQFRDDAVDAGEIGAGHSVTALYELVLADAPAETLATVRVRHKPPKGDEAMETEFAFRSAEVIPDVRQASPDFKFAAAVVLFAQALKREADADAARLSLIAEIAREGVADETNQPDRMEFLELVAEAQPYFEE